MLRRHAGVLLVLALALAAGPDPATAHDVSEGQRRILVTGSHLEYLQVGALHMLTGYDHLLFLFGVMFFLTRLSDIVRIVTAFMLGHSLTLLGATLLAGGPTPTWWTQ